MLLLLGGGGGVCVLFCFFDSSDLDFQTAADLFTSLTTCEVFLHNHRSSAPSLGVVFAY